MLISLIKSQKLVRVNLYPELKLRNPLKMEPIPLMRFLKIPVLALEVAMDLDVNQR